MKNAIFNRHTVKGFLVIYLVALAIVGVALYLQGHRIETRVQKIEHTIRIEIKPHPPQGAKPSRPARTALKRHSASRVPRPKRAPQSRPKSVRPSPVSTTKSVAPSPVAPTKSGAPTKSTPSAGVPKSAPPRVETPAAPSTHVPVPPVEVKAPPVEVKAEPQTPSVEVKAPPVVEVKVEKGRVCVNALHIDVLC